MMKLAVYLGIVGGLLLVAWGIAFAIVAEIDLSSENYSSPGLFGRDAGKAGGIILIIFGLIGLAGGVLTLKFPNLGAILMLSIGYLAVISIFLTSTSYWLLMSLLVAIIFLLGGYLVPKSNQKN